MAKRKRAWGDREWDDLARLIRKAGSRDQLKVLVDKVCLLEDFDNAILPLLAEMEEYWKHTRSPEAKRILEKRNRETGVKMRWITREEMIRKTIDAIRSSDHSRGKVFVGHGTKDAIVRRLIRKLRARTKSRD